jgi:hypothetical protein
MPAIQYWFTGGALAAFLALAATIPTLGYAWYRAATTEQDAAVTKAESAAQKQMAARVKVLLGKSLADGEGLIRELANKSADDAESDAQEWGKKAHDLIAAAYGDGEAAVFLDSSGYVFYGDGSKKSNVRNWIDGRMRRISDLVRRSDSLSAYREFDASKFQ